MNDSDMEKGLAERFRAAPHPEPSERLQQAVDADRIRASVSRGSTRPGLSLRLSGRRNVLAGLIGLAATVVLAAGLLAVVASRLTQTAAAPGAIQWEPAIKGPGVTFLFGPYLASAGGRLYMAGSISLGSGYTTEVWASADGATWERVSQPGAFEKYGSGFAAFGLSDDGNGGLIVVGSIGTGGESRAAMAWHSSDGVTWTRADTGSTDSGELMRVAARPGSIVAVGDWTSPVSSGATGSGEAANQLGAWFSADGETWRQVILPNSVSYIPTALTAWKGGFAAVAAKNTAESVSSVWTSSDGRTWEKAPVDLAGFGSTAMAGLGDRVVAVGARLDSKLGMVPASWSSTDGRTWTESDASTRDPAIMFDDVTVVGEDLVAIGSSRMGASFGPAGVPEITQPPLPAESVWTSGDGKTWRLLAENSALKFGFNLNTHITSFRGRVVVATQGGGAVEIFLGDPVP